MKGETLRRQVTITNPQGFHMRPATAFAQLASRFQCTVTLYKDSKQINGKSPLELMFLAAEQGTEVTIEASGVDAAEALDALAALLAAPAPVDDPDALPPKG
jgi:phosphotransferase system HPr (HPr) family protein